MDQLFLIYIVYTFGVAFLSSDLLSLAKFYSYWGLFSYFIGF